METVDGPRAGPEIEARSRPAEVGCGLGSLALAVPFLYPAVEISGRPPRDALLYALFVATPGTFFVALALRLLLWPRDDRLYVGRLGCRLMSLMFGAITVVLLRYLATSADSNATTYSLAVIPAMFAAIFHGCAVVGTPPLTPRQKKLRAFGLGALALLAGGAGLVHWYDTRPLPPPPSRPPETLESAPEAACRVQAEPGFPPSRLVRHWCLNGGEAHRPEVHALVPLADPERLLADVGQVVKLFSPSGEELLRELAGHTDTVHAISASRDGTRVLSGARDGTVRLWDLAAGNELAHATADARSVLGAALSSDGRVGVAIGVGPTLHVYEATTALTETAGIALFAGPWSVALRADGRRALVGCDGGRVALVDLPAGTVRELPGLAGKLGTRTTFVAFSPDGNTAVAVVERRVLTWTLSGEGVAPTGGFDLYELAWGAALSPDGSRILVASSSAAVLYDLATGKRLEQVEFGLAGSYRFQAVAFSPDGRTWFAGTDHGEVYQFVAGT